MSDDGIGAKAYHEEMRKHSRLILLLFVQDLGGNRRDGSCRLNEANFCFFIRMSEDCVGVEAYFLEEMRTLYHFVVIGNGFWW